MDFSHLPVTMTVEQVARELQLERHTARKVIEASIYHVHLSPKCIRIPRWSFLEFLGVETQESIERRQSLECLNDENTKKSTSAD